MYFDDCLAFALASDEARDEQERKRGWHTGMPTEKGNYIVHFRGLDTDGEIYEYDEVCDLDWLKKYYGLQDKADEKYFKVVAWMMYEPYIGKNT